MFSCTRQCLWRATVRGPGKLLPEVHPKLCSAGRTIEQLAKEGRPVAVAFENLKRLLVERPVLATLQPRSTLMHVSSA